MNRRDFLHRTGSCGAHLFALSCVTPNLVRSAFAAERNSRVVAEEAWGRLEQIDDGVWALISTPFTTKDFTTVCNGGIIAGDEGVLAVEAFASPKGAAWLAAQAEKLTGKRPTDVVSTHYHGDHTGGHRGYAEGGAPPRLWLTDSTRDAAAKRSPDGDRFENVSPIDPSEGATIDLGNREARLVPRTGHTASDVTIELVEPRIVWCGDLFFNRTFPNYSDATPSLLQKYVAEILAAPDTRYVPGHGPLADAEALARYEAFLGYIGEIATAAFEAGKSPQEASEGFQLPARFEDWIVWSPQNAQRAFAAWRRELQQPT